MTINESDASHPSSPEITQEDEFEIGGTDSSLVAEELEKKQVTGKSSLKTNIIKGTSFLLESNSSLQVAITPRILLFTTLAIAITFISIVINNSFLGILATLATLLLSLLILFPWLQDVIQEWFSPEDRNVFVGLIGIVVAIIGLFKFTHLGNSLLRWGRRINWDASGTLAEWFGALGQIAIAIIAVYVAWRQYVISKDLTIQQNLLTVQQNIITQQQTIDSYFQGVSDLVLDEEGLLEDWPQERAIAEGRTAAIFSSVDGSGKAKILRFLSRSKLLSPLQRDRRLGRAILDGSGGYAEDRLEGVRVIDLGVMLAGADLADNDLRWTDLSEANLIRANLSNCDLVKANLSRTILYDANLSNADLNGVRLFYGLVEQVSPRSRTERPNYETGEHTGAVVENANFTNAQRMSESTRYYCCAWCGEKTRSTIPGGCEGIPNKLGR
ncbi:pentapeptide repeat-containing protein [Anabaena sp. UHCC 0187]|uniref:pentapeptide repeat-containing protein n=1 Tax=Anabaena sp. UHCC 0187 TaxID=2590018 RepID=UPI0014469B7A|nr:pentapeptide repeat-containing protein [Anabaena sp. UHCC 0187]MTJ13256.1 pentapeptide repeat-containing protein [Anabaena sp. UHCC 0187]